MKAPKVRLYIRVRDSHDRSVFADPVWTKNRCLREGWAIVQGKPEVHPEGRYYLRYACAGKRVWKPVGKSSDLALTALRNLEHDLQAAALGRTAVEPRPVPVEIPGSALTVTASVEAYLTEVASHRARKTIAACKNILALFDQRFGSRTLGSINRTELLEHITFLRQRGLGERTVFNHLARIATLLKQNGVPQGLRASDWPNYDEKAVSAYDLGQLSRLLCVAAPQERLVFEFFLSTGFREQEVMHATWTDINFRDRVVLVRAKPEYNFRPKDKEERLVPIPDALVEALAKHQVSSRSALIFPTPAGQPDGHLLRKLQRLALRAGLNCGTCRTKGGLNCKQSATCRRWGLHEFRRTFATAHAEAGVPAPTIQRWLGHSSLTTTMRYLAIADLRSEKTRLQVNTTFGFLGQTGMDPA